MTTFAWRRHDAQQSDKTPSPPIIQDKNIQQITSKLYSFVLTSGDEEKIIPREQAEISKTE